MGGHQGFEGEKAKLDVNYKYFSFSRVKSRCKGVAGIMAQALQTVVDGSSV